MYETLQPQGVEGIVAKPGRRPRRLALLPDTESQPRLSAPLDTVLAARLGALLADTPTTGEHRAATGETYTALHRAGGRGTGRDGLPRHAERRTGPLTTPAARPPAGGHIDSPMKTVIEACSMAR
ncbi:hypothetical protein ABZ905_28140 [Streptomyces parvus]|uniref:hypothetical protein n=1 Tax=Streptomyces parvus TaxID=66428 RepID=UPI00340938AF